MKLITKLSLWFSHSEPKIFDPVGNHASTFHHMVKCLGDVQAKLAIFLDEEIYRKLGQLPPPKGGGLGIQ